MPLVSFSTLPASARVWVFASDRALAPAEAAQLLGAVDDYLDQWKAHGTPLRCARDWRHDRFLAIGVDPTAEQASGCSIDALFRRLQEQERQLDTPLVAGGRIFFRSGDGAVHRATRPQLPALVHEGTLTGDTPVFDTTVTDAGSWRERFERPAADTWVGNVLAVGAVQDSQRSSRSATNASSVRNG